MPTEAKPVSKSAQKPRKSKAASPIVSSSPPRTSPRRTSGRSWTTTRRRAPNCRPASVTPANERARQDGRQRRRLDRFSTSARPERSQRQGSELDGNRAGQGLVHALPRLRPARAVVRQDVEARRDRTRKVSAEVSSANTSCTSLPWTAAGQLRRCLEAEVPHASKTNFEMTGGDFRFQ
jgi:hypothetical protein